MIPGHKTELDRYTPDEMRELYKTNPGLFDRLAAEAIEQACISETPEETLKLQQMQRAIDTQLQKARTQPERMQIMEKIFYGNVFDLVRIMEPLPGLIRPDDETEDVRGGKPLLVLVKE